MNRRELLAALMAAPFVPSLLKASPEIPNRDLPQLVEGVHVVAKCKPGTVFFPNKKGGWTRQAWSQGMKLPLKIIKHTPYRTTAEIEVPCVITNIVYQDRDITYTLLADDSSILVRRGDILNVEVWHHGCGTIFMDGKQEDYSIPVTDPVLLALLATDRETADALVGHRPGQAPWDRTQIYHVPYRNRVQYYDESLLAAQQGWAEGKCRALKNKNRKIKLSLA